MTTTKASQALVEISYSKPFSGSPWIAVDHHWRARMHPRPSRRTTLSNDTLAAPDASVGASIGAPQVALRLVLFLCIRVDL